MPPARTCTCSSTPRPPTRSCSPGSRASRASPSAGRTPARRTRSAPAAKRPSSPSFPPRTRRIRVDRSSSSPGRGMTNLLSAAEGRDMAVRLAALLPRAVIVALIWILGTAAFTLAADNTIVGPATPDPAAGAAAARTELIVRGPYAQLGRPVDVAPYRGTTIRLAGLASVTTPAAKPKAKPAPKPAAKPKPVVKPAVKPTPRPPAFTLAGAPKEPLDEMTLPARALWLQDWVANRPKTGVNVRRWVYQHAWIVTGAKFGWWHGAEALQTLIRVDQRVQRRWGVGTKSERVARAALAQVRRAAR